MQNKDDLQLLSQDKVNELAHTLEIMAEVGVFDVVGSAELVTI